MAEILIVDDDHHLRQGFQRLLDAEKLLVEEDAVVSPLYYKGCVPWRAVRRWSS